MITLFEQDIRTANRRSSKGNQLKWQKDDIWYKADYTGYEGLSEYLVSHLLTRSSLSASEYVLYGTEEISYKSKNRIFYGCSSRNFLPEGWRLVTLERLFEEAYGESLYKNIYKIGEHEHRLRFLTEQTERLTGLHDFGQYLAKLLTIDAVFLNEDRHTHNIAVMVNDRTEYQLCPAFDFGAALLSDTTMDYPPGGDLITYMNEVQAKTFCDSFDEQLDIAEKLCGNTISFSFSGKDVKLLLQDEPYYPEEIKKRVYEILAQRIRKYRYLFTK